MTAIVPIDDKTKEALSCVLWIGGATDAGKTTIAQLIAERRKLPCYHYDRYDVAHHELLARANRYVPMTLEESWLRPTPPELLERCWQSFANRLPLMLEDLLAMPKDTPVLAEGFGLTPELIAPLLSDSRKAIYLFPTATFKYASMERRQKLAGLGEQAAEARKNLFIRDMLLADRLRGQARAQGFAVLDVDGTDSAEQIALSIEQQFAPFL